MNIIIMLFSLYLTIQFVHVYFISLIYFFIFLLSSTEGNIQLCYSKSILNLDVSFHASYKHGLTRISLTVQYQKVSKDKTFLLDFCLSFQLQIFLNVLFLILMYIRQPELLQLCHVQLNIFLRKIQISPKRITMYREL